jgi:hypothetical protein
MIAQFISQHASQLATLDIVLAVATALVVFYTCGVTYYEAAHRDLAISMPARRLLVTSARHWLRTIGINLAFAALFLWLQMDTITVVLAFNIIRVVFQTINVSGMEEEVTPY